MVGNKGGSKRAFYPAVALILGSCVLTSCGGSQPAPIASRQTPPSILITHHIVDKGETLFELAWRYEKDLQQLAAVNGLQKPYRIYPGQRLNLDTSSYVRPKPVVPRTIYKPKVVTQPPLKAPSQADKPSTTQQTASKQAASKPQTGNVQSPATVMAPSVTPSQALPSNWSWQWPVKGRVVRNFNANEFFKGIDISSLPGAPVYPAAPGTVAYSGSGLRGYGHLIIIKHNDIYLSAYAHNRKVYIKEGEQVLQNQKIAEVGGDPANVRRFYFEIRKDGKPVNPLQYLP